MTPNYKKAIAYVTSLGISLTEAERNLQGLEGIVIKIGGECLNGQRTELVKSIAVLNQLGVYPIITHGGGPQIDALMQERGVPIERKYRQRVTSEEVLKCVVEALSTVNVKLTHDINRYGGNAVSVAGQEIVYVTQLKPELGFVGEPIGVNRELLIQLLQIGYSPVLWCIGYDLNHQAYNVNGDRVATAIIRHIGAQKLISITDTGGVFDGNGALRSTIKHLEIDELIETGTVSGGMAEKILQAKLLFEDKSLLLPKNFKVQIIGPNQLLQELLTDKGAGTEIVKGNHQ